MKPKGKPWWKAIYDLYPNKKNFNYEKMKLEILLCMYWNLKMRDIKMLEPNLTILADKLKWLSESGRY
jgi:hypothetical protein